MAARLYNFVLCALLLVLSSPAANAITRSENRVGGSAVFSSNFASEESAKPIGTPSENAGYGYDFASGAHKYLYTEDNPVNHIDPSGHGIGLGFDFSLDYSIGSFDIGFQFSASTTLGFGPSQENDLTPNWGDGVGPVTHTLAYVDITFPSGSAQHYADEMYSDLQQFKYFYPPNNSSVSVSGKYAYFTPLGAFGALSDLNNPTSVAVQLVNGPGKDQLSAVTLGHHMLVGIRRWQSMVENPRVVRVETEAYEQSNGWRNRIGRWLMGQSKQYEVWKDYLSNIANHWDTAAGATSSSVVTDPAEEVGSQNPWRSQLPPSLQ